VIRAIRAAIAVGPFSYTKATITGFILGSVTFIVMASLIEVPNLSSQWRDYVTCVGTGILSIVSAAALANYFIGKET
jgi:hypothetical protein